MLLIWRQINALLFLLLLSWTFVCFFERKIPLLETHYSWKNSVGGQRRHFSCSSLPLDSEGVGVDSLAEPEPIDVLILRLSTSGWGEGYRSSPEVSLHWSPRVLLQVEQAILKVAHPSRAGYLFWSLFKCLKTENDKYDEEMAGIIESNTDRLSHRSFGFVLESTRTDLKGDRSSGGEI